MNKFIFKYLHLQYSSDRKKGNISKKLFDSIEKYYDEKDDDHADFLYDRYEVRARRIHLEFMINAAKDKLYGFENSIEELKIILRECERMQIDHIMINLRSF